MGYFCRYMRLQALEFTAVCHGSFDGIYRTEDSLTSELKNLEVQYDKKWTTITLDLPKEVNPQKAKVCLDFVGELNDKMRGFYRSSYKDATGNERFIASTQFESTYARLSFPCWDEPIYKAKFDVTLIVDSNLTALSNMVNLYH
uniref:Aminopeptidase N-like N-terminal domain-containing protein n=1 Tax=Parascaris equorum TaxID=6256 RepID=A0A914RZV0_PAREQ